MIQSMIVPRKTTIMKNLVISILSLSLSLSYDFKRYDGFSEKDQLAYFEGRSGRERVYI